CFQYSRSPLTF
nr:immunoglobulin light chain junction region [Macaca mulatta]MOX23709.1 immunoglobulin light chain junction region [Macaca mulatta]MOX23846.1 immunoglobulin light chain junction region [Macaca mulatta]MOX24523.1 immunoglobulin light chain junction region [Macaca mulatta]MOX26678.1 immunoglobulin light chain junction region [Macaca mulatta]